MIHKDTVLHSIYAAAAVLILTLTGIFGTFSGRAIIRGELTLSTLTLALMIGVPAYFIASRSREKGIAATVLNGLIAGAIIGGSLALLVIYEASNDIRFVFQNIGRARIGNLNGGTLTAGKPIDAGEGEWAGLLEMLAFCLSFGALMGAFIHVPRRLREVVVVALALTLTIMLAQGQLNSIITLPDALVLAFTAGLAYAVAHFAPVKDFPVRLGIGAMIGVGVALVVFAIGQGGGLDRGGVLFGSGTAPVILTMVTDGRTFGFVVGLALTGLSGAFITRSSGQVHDAFWYLAGGLIALGLVNATRRADNVWLGPASIFALLGVMLAVVPLLGKRTEQTFNRHELTFQRNMNRAAMGIALGVLLLAPQFMGLYISNVFNQIALFAIMGIGLNVMIGYTGLLDLGYVASFAIGAYTLGVLTTPSIVTCGGVHPDNIGNIAAQCTGVMTFWEALPICVIFSGLTGTLLGIPVLRLRGDYLAIVTLGFGEITGRIIASNDFKDLLGGAQGIPGIPSPVINLSGFNPEWTVTLSRSTEMYYLFLFSVIVTMFVVLQLANSRTGRAWRAIKADEDVAQAMGINLMNNKLLAFGVSSAFAGLGGAVFGASVQGIFPRSFTLLVSINVLSLIIIGGMGSIPGVILGAFILIGLPELLRELDAYRLLAFGALLVGVMIVKPEGLLPPKPPELSQVGEEARRQEATAS